MKLIGAKEEVGIHAPRGINNDQCTGPVKLLLEAPQAHKFPGGLSRVLQCTLLWGWTATRDLTESPTIVTQQPYCAKLLQIKTGHQPSPDSAGISLKRSFKNILTKRSDLYTTRPSFPQTTSDIASGMFASKRLIFQRICRRGQEKLRTRH